MKKFLIVCAVGLLLGFGARALWGVISPTVFGSRIISKTLERASYSNGELVKLMEDSLGFVKPKTYIVLFLNNTELRPGGGFIGSYGLVKASGGHLSLIKLEGTEIFDGHSDPNKLLDPPKPLGNKLKVKKWFFRDSNWSPDFKVSAERALDFYKRENGYLANDVDGVIAFTPTVIEKFLEINGPISVDGITFTSENVTEKLQYEVEYGFAEKGISRDERKDILKDFSVALIKAAKQNGIFNVTKYLTLAERMLTEKQVFIYSTNANEQARIEKLGFAGRLSESTNDYLTWVDANLGALKTDWAIQRSLSYDIAPSSTDYIATAKMSYRHLASVDWRTSRYISYTRIYVPLGSELVGVKFRNRNLDLSKEVDLGTELGRNWFGVYISFEPKTISELQFSYKLPRELNDQIKTGKYNLAVDKQLGTNGVALTLNLNFGRNVVSASPGESLENHGDKRYDVVTDLSINRLFEVQLEH